MKKTILHIIYNLGRGGAETMLVTVVKELGNYNNIVVTLFPKNHFNDELQCDKYYCLNLKSILQLPFAIFKLKKIIKNNKVDIVHSHLFWPTILSRMATPKNIPLITTIHAFIASSIEYRYRHIRVLDRFTYSLRKNIIIAVAEGAKQEYFNFLHLKPYKAYTLYTFVDTKIFDYKKSASVDNDQPVFKLITVAALRQQKNHMYLLKAFKVLDNKQFQLDIYGEGPLHAGLKLFIENNNLNINLKGEANNIHELLNEYHLFVMASTYEGFSLSVLEAMAMSMPLLLSDIRSFMEQCADTALYFSLKDTTDFADKLKQLVFDKNKRIEMGVKARERAINNFTLGHHVTALQKIYAEALFK